MTQVQIEDSRHIGELGFIDWDQLRGSTFMITGSTGLIGSNLVNALAYNSREKDLGIRLILPVRNMDAAEKLFGWTDAEIIKYELGKKPEIKEHADYIVHLASPTSSRFFSEKPVDTMLANIEGTRALLDWAAENPVKKMVVTSSMEVYGFPQKGHRVREDELGAFETMNARNSYPIGKIAVEALCFGYYSQYDVPAVILRATQTFGPGVSYNDGRVFAEFMRCIEEKKDIVLKTKGLTERSYLYTADAVSAMLIALLKAEPGNSYTAANPGTYCSIRDMAKMAAEDIAGGSIKVVFDTGDDTDKLGYADTLYMDLDTGKMEALGWEPRTNLKTMYERMIRGIREDA